MLCERSQVQIATYCDSVYMPFWKKQNYRDRTQSCGIGQALATKGPHEGNLKCDETVLHIDFIGGLSTLTEPVKQR